MVLRRQRVYLEISHPTYLDFPTNTEDSDPEPEVTNLSDDDLPFTVTNFDKNRITEEYTLIGESTFLDHPFRPHPPYEVFMPVTRNLMVGDDPNDLPFIPFADDPSYDYSLDIEEHKYFRWQRPHVDSESMSITRFTSLTNMVIAQVIACETVERLIGNHGISPEQIDSTKILPLSCIALRKLHKQRLPRAFSLHDDIR